jgi:hypothetical protein
MPNIPFYMKSSFDTLKNTIYYARSPFIYKQLLGSNTIEQIPYTFDDDYHYVNDLQYF